MDAATDMLAEPSHDDTPDDTIAACVALPPSHRIMVYAKDGGRHVRFISDTTPVPDGELIDVVTLKSRAEVEAINRALGQILKGDALAPNADGWHRIAADATAQDFLARLFRAAQNIAWADPGLPGRVELDESFLPPTALPEALATMLPAPVSPPPLAALVEAEAPAREPLAPAVVDLPTRQTWDSRRIAWLGFLVGRGKSAKAIADDPLIGSTPGNVFRQVCRFGLSLNAVPQGEVAFALPSWAITKLDRAAEVAHLQRDAFVRQLVLNALRDGYGTVAIK